MRKSVAAATGRRRVAPVAAAWLLVLLAGSCQAAPATAAAQTPFRVEAARSSWDAQSPPDNGWVSVALPDNWNRRWPGFDGVVWYRLNFEAAASPADVGVFVSGVCLAGVISINGILLERDASLVEPLSRMWNAPRYLLLSAPMLHAGENVLMFRVSGLAAFLPGLRETRLGPPQIMQRRYETERWARQDLLVFSMGIAAALSCFFFALWLLQRSETSFGWYAAQEAAWLAYAANYVVTSPWPFPSSGGFVVANSIALLLFAACHALFVLRYCERRWPRREKLLWASAVVATLLLVLAPDSGIGRVRDLVVMLAVAIAFVSNGAFVYLAWRFGRIDQRVLSLIGVIGLVAASHDVLTFFGRIGGHRYFNLYVTNISVIGVALMLAWNFVRNLRRIEGFNAELTKSVADARAELAATLRRQHDLELVQARLGERVSLAHDLHDGLGGMLIGDIAKLEQAPATISSNAVLDMLRDLRNDLRLIIDTASAQHYGEHSLAQLLAPLRHRIATMLDAHGIESSWRVSGLDDVYLTIAQSLDVLRILQEALVNVLKHSRASHVHVNFDRAGATIRLKVEDDGVGLSCVYDERAIGTGMHSMRARAARLAAALSITSNDGSTTLRLEMTLPSRNRSDDLPQAQGDRSAALQSQSGPLP